MAECGVEYLDFGDSIEVLAIHAEQAEAIMDRFGDVADGGRGDDRTLENVDESTAERGPSQLALGVYQLRRAAKPARPARGTRVVAVRHLGRTPHVGGWAIAIFFLGIVGGLIGYLHLKPSDPARAEHVLKWSAIWSVLVSVLWVVLWIVIYAAFEQQLSALR